MAIITKFDTQEPEPTGNVGGIISGKVSVTTPFTSVAWRELQNKFKKFWGVIICPSFSDDWSVNQAFAYMVAGELQVFISNVIDSTITFEDVYFIARGEI